jgi:hypothetical protein
MIKYTVYHYSSLSLSLFLFLFSFFFIFIIFVLFSFGNWFILFNFDFLNIFELANAKRISRWICKQFIIKIISIRRNQDSARTLNLFILFGLKIFRVHSFFAFFYLFFLYASILFSFRDAFFLFVFLIVWLVFSFLLKCFLVRINK